jgi:DNA mismatch repair protein MutS2
MDSFTLNKIEFDLVRRILSEYCSSSLGKGLALRIGPSRNPEVINHWLAQVTQMVKAIGAHGLPPFGGITDITAALANATPGAGASGEDFAKIAEFLEGAGNVRAWFGALAAEFNLLHELGTGVGNFEGEIKAIRAIIAPDGSVADNASPRLAEIRSDMAATGKKIHDVIYGYLHQPDVAKLLQNVSVTLHGDRYVLPVKQENRGRLPGVIHRASNTGATVFIEPDACVEMNNHLCDLYMEERREIERLLHTLAIRLSPRMAEIVATLRNLSQIDLLSAKAQYAYKFDMTCPAVSENGPLQFNQARHPLLMDQWYRQELRRTGVPPVQGAAFQSTDPASVGRIDRRDACRTVVPIDVRLGADFDMLVITGSNTGGKTVALKTLAILSIMAQSGMHIPVQRDATLPAFRDIFIDVGDEQSLEQSLSTFGAHVKRIRYILHKADKSCLVLLDELGAGTDPEEGGAIGQAVLDELREMGCLSMVTTHLNVLKAYAYNNERVDNASVEFDTETLRPTYRLSIGTPGESHAITVAQSLGLPKRLVENARRYMTEQGKQFNRAIRATSMARQSAEDARSAATQATVAARGQQEVYEAKLADLHSLKEDFETWLMTLGELKSGDQIFIPSLGKPGTLARLELHRQVAVVDSGSMQVEVPLKELMPDLGQEAIREQINTLRQQILQQAKATEDARAQAQRIQEEYHKSLQQQKERARQFDNWLGAIARLKVGDEVPIAIKPGQAKLVKVDLPGLRATVSDGVEEREISIQDLFPQTGPFAPRETSRERQRPEQRTHRYPEPHPGQAEGERGRAGEGEKRIAAAPRGQHGGDGGGHHEEPREARPMARRSADSQAARAGHDALLATEPGKQVFVVPFNKRATLIRINAEKGVAVVQSGIFEMQIPLADLEPIQA